MPDFEVHIEVRGRSMASAFCHGDLQRVLRWESQAPAGRLSRRILSGSAWIASQVRSLSRSV